MKYFVTYMPYSDDINGVYVQVGETREYLKVQSTSKAACEFMVRKSNYLVRGGDIKLYPMEEEELKRKLKRKLARQKAVNKLRKLNFDKLTDSQLERIMNIILEEKK